MEHNFEVMRLCVKAYMKDISFKHRAMTDIDDQIARIRAGLESQGVVFDRECVSGGRCAGDDKMVEQIARIVDLEDERKARAVEFFESYEQLLSICEPVNFNRWLVWLHYGQGNTWTQVSCKALYSVSHVKRLADEGIRELYPLIPEQFRRSAIPNAAPA